MGIGIFALLLMAVSLDTRYWKDFFVKREMPTGVDVIVEYIQGFLSIHATCLTGASTDRTLGHIPKKHKLILFQRLNQSCLLMNQMQHCAQAEWKQCQEASIPGSEYPLTWWKQNSHCYPVNSRFVQTFLHMPTSSVSWKRHFSSLVYVVSKMRWR